MNDHKIQPLLRHGQDQDDFNESADEYGDYDDDEDDEVDRQQYGIVSCDVQF